MKRGDCLASFRRNRLSSAKALILGSLGWLALEMGAAIAPVVAQPVSALSACEAPGPSEYLLLVVLQTEAAQGKLAETLPPTVQAPTCNYLGSRVARMGGFQKPEDADAWASYLRDVASLPAFVAKPTQGGATTIAAATSPAIQDPGSLTASAQPSTPTVTSTQIKPQATSNVSVPPLDVLPPPVIPSQPRLGAKIDVPQVGTAPAAPAVAAPPVPTTLPQPVIPAAVPSPVPATVPTAPPAVAQAPASTAPKTPPAGTFSVASYEPKLLSNGYAVLVDYGNQTSLVSLLRQLTKKPVGLASYGQRPFLLVNYTPDSKAALATLKTLDKSGFRTMLVDGGRVTLLTSDVQVK